MSISKLTLHSLFYSFYNKRDETEKTWELNKRNFRPAFFSSNDEVLSNNHVILAKVSYIIDTYLKFDDYRYNTSIKS